MTQGAAAGTPPVVTIDGPAGSGKSSTAKEVARRLGFRHLDSGALYRALTLAACRAGLDPETWSDLGEDDFLALDVSVTPANQGFDVLVDGERPGAELRSPGVTELAPLLASNPAARTRLGGLQRSAARFGGLVADGRDMGSIVFPDAALKVFLEASLEERARRRVIQEGRAPDVGAVVEEAGRIERRDAADSSRAVAPLVRPAGALVIDTTGLSFDAQVERIVRAAVALTTRGTEE